MVVKTFRGLLADGGQDQIHLGTIKGKVGYKIVKFQLMGYDVSAEDYENVVKIYKDSQSTIDGFVNFTNSTLLAAGIWNSSGSSNVYPDDMTVIFDNEIFNQDIYITSKDTKTNSGMNYYIELEVIPLTDQGAEYTTLKDIRTQS